MLEELNHVNSRGYVLVWGAATLAQLRRDAAAVRKHVDEVVSLSEEHGLGLWLAYGKVFRGWVLAEQGRQEEGRAELAKALAECQATRTRMHRPYHLSLLAEALRRSGRSEEGLQVIDEALAVVEETEERWWEADLVPPSLPPGAGLPATPRAGASSPAARPRLARAGPRSSRRMGVLARRMPPSAVLFGGRR